MNKFLHYLLSARRSKGYLLTISFLIFISACSDVSNGELSGEPPITINKFNLPKILERIETASESNQPLVFNSYGGSTFFSLLLSSQIDEKLNIVVDQECTSNCAEIIMPSAKSLLFKNRPIIGFHGNTTSYRYYVEQSNLNDKSQCNWVYEENFQKLIKAKAINPNFWVEQMDRLQPKVSFKLIRGECPQINYNFKNHIWLPNSDQLKNLMNIRFQGSICADNYRRCSKRVDRRWAKNTRVVIGDKVYVSRGE